MMDKKLTPEQSGDILVHVTASVPAPRMDCIGFYLEKFENWLNENTEQETRSRCKCGADLEWHEYGTWYGCPNCGSV